MKTKFPLIIVVLMLGLFTVAYLVIPRSYSIYNQAIDVAKNDQYIRDTLGNDICDSVFIYSHINKGLARIEVSISGSKDSGLLLIRGKKEKDKWELISVLFEHKPNSKRYAVFKISPP